MNLSRHLLAATLLAGAPLAQAVDLMGVYELAQSYDAELRAAEQRLSAAGEGPVQARAGLLPSLSLSVGRELGQSRTTIESQRLDTTDIDSERYSLEFSQSLYDDSNYARLEQSRAELTSAQGVYAEAWQDFLLRVSERYFDVLTALDSVRFARAEETALRRQFEQAEQRFEVGLAAVTDVHEARAVFDAAQARVILTENQLEDAREALREVTGRYFENYARLIDDVPLDRPEPDAVEEWVELALMANPSIIQQRGQRDAAESGVRLARAGHLPTLALSGSYSRNVNNEFVGRDPATQEALASAELINQGWQVGVTLDIPLFQGFAVQSRRREAGYSLNAADETLDQVERSVIRRTENAFRAILAGTREVESRRQALVSAESALEATNAGFEVGTRTIVDVLQSEQRFFQAERDYSEARHQFILNNLRLSQAAGILNEEDLEEVNQLLR